MSVLTNENAKEFIEFACNHSEREIDLKVRGADPMALPKDKVKVLTSGHVQVTTYMTLDDYKKIERVKVIEAQKQNVANIGTLMGICAETHLEKHDPVRKAKRAKENLCKQENHTRQRTAAQKHAVNKRDEGRCTFVDEHGKKCNNEWFTEHHHIKYFKDGGSNDLENMTTLCAHHHNFIHRYNGQLVKDNFVPYRIQ